MKDCLNCSLRVQMTLSSYCSVKKIIQSVIYYWTLSSLKAHNALVVEEEAAALSVWAIACLCGSLRLEHVSSSLLGISSPLFP